MILIKGPIDTGLVEGSENKTFSIDQTELLGIVWEPGGWTRTKKQLDGTDL